MVSLFTAAPTPRCSLHIQLGFIMLVLQAGNQRLQCVFGHKNNYLFMCLTPQPDYELLEGSELRLILRT